MANPPVFTTEIVKEFAYETAQKFVEEARQKFAGFDDERTKEIVAVCLTIGKVDFEIAEKLSPGLFSSEDNAQKETLHLRKLVKKCYETRDDLAGTLPFRLFILRFLGENPKKWEKQAKELEEKIQVEYPHEKLPSVNLAEKIELPTEEEVRKDIVKEVETLVSLFHSLSNDDQQKFIAYINSYSALSQ